MSLSKATTSKTTAQYLIERTKEHNPSHEGIYNFQSIIHRRENSQDYLMHWQAIITALIALFFLAV